MCCSDESEGTRFAIVLRVSLSLSSHVEFDLGPTAAKTCQANVDALSKNGSTPLLVSAREGHTAVCEARPCFRYMSSLVPTVD